MFCLSLTVCTGNLFSRLLGTYFAFFMSELSDNAGGRVNVQSRGTSRAQPAGSSTISTSSRSSRLPHMPRAAAADPLPLAVHQLCSSAARLTAPWLQSESHHSEDTGQPQAARDGLLQESKDLPWRVLFVLMAQSAFSLPFFPPL